MGLVELHVEMTLREVLRRAERSANIDADPEALEWERLREHNVDELQAARTLLWAASDWLPTTCWAWWPPQHTGWNGPTGGHGTCSQNCSAATKSRSDDRRHHQPAPQ